MKLISVGETTIDYYPAIEQSFVGGISLNFAVHARRCGAESVAMVSAVGQDANGKLILDGSSRSRSTRHTSPCCQARRRIVRSSYSKMETATFHPTAIINMS